MTDRNDKNLDRTRCVECQVGIKYSSQASAWVAYEQLKPAQQTGYETWSCGPWWHMTPLRRHISKM